MTRQSQGHSNFKAVFLIKEQIIDRKPYMPSPMDQSHVILSTFKGQSQGHTDLEVLYLVKEPTYVLYATLKQ